MCLGDNVDGMVVMDIVFIFVFWNFLVNFLDVERIKYYLKFFFVFVCEFLYLLVINYVFYYFYRG